MKKEILLTTIIFSFFLSVSSAFSDDKATDPKVWDVYNRKGAYIGTVVKENKHFVFYDKDEITLKPKGDNVWEMYMQKDEFVGTVEKFKERFRYYDKHENYIGTILGTKSLLPRGSGVKNKKTIIGPGAAKFYLNVLEAIENIE